MPIDYEALRKQREAEQKGLLNAPVDLSGTEGRIKADRGLFADRFSIDTRTAALKTPQLDRNLGENLEKIRFDRQKDVLSKKWQSIYDAALQATGDVRAATQYANQWLDQTTSTANTANANATLRASADRKSAIADEFANRGVVLQQQYESQYDPMLAIASLLSAGVQGGTAAYMYNRDKPKTKPLNPSGQVTEQTSFTPRSPESYGYNTQPKSYQNIYPSYRK